MENRVANDQHDIIVYGGYLKDQSKLKSTASGGVATALAEDVMKNGGYIAGVVYSDDFYKAQYIVSNKIEDIERFKGSKYCEVEFGKVFKEVKKLLEEKKQVLFFGVPCVAAAIKKYCGEMTENLLVCETICHGPLDKKVHEEYVKDLEKRYKSKVNYFNVRYKKNGKWMPKYLIAKFENGKEIKIPFEETEYGVAFSIMGQERCFKCKFKGHNRQGDLMIGDFWGANSRDEYWNSSGVSVIFVETVKGLKSIKRLNTLKLFETSFIKAVEHNPMVVDSRKKHSDSDRFRMTFENKGLRAAVIESISLKTWIKLRIKEKLANI